MDVIVPFAMVRVAFDFAFGELVIAHFATLLVLAFVELAEVDGIDRVMLEPSGGNP
jgi:hypothetical protein